VTWEEEGLNRADSIVFWIPRDVTGKKVWDYPMVGLTTNDEYGVWKNSGKVVLGAPGWADHVSYQEYYAEKYGVPGHSDLGPTLKLAIEQIGEGALRQGGETQVPLHIWKRPEFQEWYTAQKMAGNRLDGARVSWTFRVPPVAPFIDKGPPKGIFAYGIHANVHIGSEGRNKTNEAVIFRPDMSAVLLYGRNPTEVVIVKEFRSSVRNEAGFVFELPGGSASGDVLEVAVQEVREETGLDLDPSRFKHRDTRQVAATLSAHVVSLFSVELTASEIALLKEDKIVHGADNEERTYVEVWGLSKVRERLTTDWATLGMILSIVTS
jgi:8-oxo-dGTP pyrophosphatase MutT (NUDIX family)